MAEKVEEIAHSNLGPSSADRWMNCPGSNQVIDKLPEGEGRHGSIFADEGSAAHHVAEQCLLSNQEAWEWAGQSIEVGKRSFLVDQEMVEGVQEYLDLVHKLMSNYEEYGSELVIEHGTGSILDDDAFGTCDARIIVPGLGLLIVVDFKYGRGIVCEPDKEQLLLYGYYGVENWPYPDRPVQKVELWIAQPRIPHPRGTCRNHKTTPAELGKFFADVAVPSMEETRKKGALLVVGDWCRMCPARDHCPAMKSEVANFSSDIEPEALTLDEIADMLAKASIIKKYLDGLEAEAFKRMKNGDSIRGYKLVYKQANRVFKESRVIETDEGEGIVALEDAVLKQFGEDAYQPRKFKTPPNIEKLPGGKKFVSQWAYKPETGLTIAADTDKRRAVKLTGDEIFGEQDE